MAKKAIELDNTLSQAHSAMASVHFYFDWNWVKAEASFRKALEINPNDALAHSKYSEFLTMMLRHDESFKEAKHAEELDPLSLDSSFYVGESLYYAGKTDQAIMKLNEVLEREPDHIYALVMLGHCYWTTGLREEAGRTWGKMHGILGNQELTQAFAELSVEEALQKWLELAKGNKASPWFDHNISMAGTLVLLGEKEEALEWLEKAYMEKDPQLPAIRIWPGFDTLQDEPRYQDLVRRMNFPENE